MSFKLLAIVPLNGCGDNYRKSLEKGKVYQFYKNYDIVFSEDKKTIIRYARSTNR